MPPEDPQTPQIAPEEGAASPSAPDPWQSWQQAGFAPDQNPHEIRQSLDWVQAITDESRHELELERSLREWGHLPEGVSLQEVKAWAQSQAQQRQDPFGQQPPPAQYPGAPQQNGYPTPGYEDPYAQPTQQPIDPNQMRQVWQQDMREVMAQERAQFEQQLQASRLQDDLSRQFERVSTQHNLTEVDRARLQRDVDWRLRSGEVKSQEQLATVTEDAWRDLAEYRQQAVAAVIQAQQGAPRTLTPMGATPGALPPPQGIAGAMERMRAQMGIVGE
jgi:hypothetical protein